MPKCVVFFPFRLAAGQNFRRDLSRGFEQRVFDFTVLIAEKNEVPYLQIGTFPDEAAATAFLPKVHAALMWAALKQGLSPEFKVEPQEVVLAEDRVAAGRNLAESFGVKPEEFGPVDCLIDTGRPAILPDGKVTRYLSAGDITAIVTFVPAQTLGSISEAISLPHVERVVGDAKLKVALELYAGFIRETSMTARFLTLIMALEALAPAEAKHRVVQELIDEWMRELENRQARVRRGEKEWDAYDALAREVGFRREVSIRQRIRTLVRNTLEAHGDADADDMARTAVELYDHRSTLVHDGVLPEGELSHATETARTIVRRVLEARFVFAAQ